MSNVSGEKQQSDERPDWCEFCGWECADADELSIHIADCEPFDG